MIVIWMTSFCQYLQKISITDGKKKKITKEDITAIPHKGDISYPDIPHIIISNNDVSKLLCNISPQKAADPDSIPTRLSFYSMF